jgi:long-chain fatty acid transport protein
MKIHLNCRRAIVTSMLAATFFPTLASASGFALIETNARGQGNAYAGAAAHTPDASTIFFNPAGMAEIEGDQLTIAAHYISPSSSFENDGSTSGIDNPSFSSLNGEDDDGGSPAIVPNIYWVKTLDESSKFGLGINSPFGLATEYDDDWVGRYHGVLSDLKIININPSYAYKVNDKLSIGAGVDVMLGTVKLTSAIDFGAICMASFSATVCNDLGALPQQADGMAILEGDNYDDINLGYNFGLTYKLTEESALGVSYRSEVDIDVTGTADFKVPAAGTFVYASNLFLDTDLQASVTMPASLSLSYALESGNITYLADATWTGWSAFQELRVKYDNSAQPDTVTTEDWNNTMRYSVGIDYQYDDETVYRVGVAYDESPTPNKERRTARLPGSDRTWLSLGLSKQLDTGMSVDVGYSHLFVDDAPINNEFESSVPTLAADLNGKYTASIDIFSVQLNWQY